MGQTTVGRTRIVLAKTPISPTSWRLTGYDQPFTPAAMIDMQRKQGRAVKYVVQVSARPLPTTTAVGAGQAATLPLGSGAVSDRSEFYDPRTDLRSTTGHSGPCQFVHALVDLDPSAFDTAAQNKLDPRQRACPVTAASIERFVTLMRGVMAGVDSMERQEEQSKAASSSSAPAAAAAAASSSSSSASLSSCVVVHDLYGYNLCGFLVSCFLVEEYGSDVLSAVNDVADSRPPGLYSSVLFQALINRYFEPDSEALMGAAEAARASGADPNDAAVQRLTCLPVIPPLPKPDWDKLDWTWSGLPPPIPTATPLPVSSSSAAAAAAAAAPEEPKRKIRKKAAPPPASSAAAAAAMTAPAAASSSAFSSAAAAAATAAAATSAASKRPFAGFAPPLEDHAAKRAKPNGPAPIATFSAPGPAAAKPSGPRSPQPLFSVKQPSYPVPAASLPPPAAAANGWSSAASSSSPSVSSASAAASLAAQLQRDHPFLVAARPDKAASLLGVLGQVFPAASMAKFKAGGSVADGGYAAFLRPPPLTKEVLQLVHSAPVASKAPYLLSWLPQHYPCMMLLLREQVWLIFEHQLCFLVPNLHFPKRKSPQDNINKFGNTQTCAKGGGARE